MGVELATYALIASGIGTVATVIGQQQSAKAQQDQAEDQAQQAVNQAAYQKDSAKAQAEKIRRLGAQQKSEARAALAASGVKVGEGTALEVEKEITKNSEEDALSAIISGKRSATASEDEADLFMKAGSNARTNANYASAGTVLSGATTIASGWKSSAKGGK